VPFPAAGTWLKYDLAAGTVTVTSVTGGSLALTVPASTGWVFVREDGVSGVP